MFLDANTGMAPLAQRPDVCVIGAGIAGLILARRLEASGLSVWLFESGGHRPQRRAEALNAGRSNLPDYPFHGSRLRVFGGTSVLWAGACIPLEESDFAPRDWLAHSGWPIRRSELDEHYAVTAEDFGLAGMEQLESVLKESPFGTGSLTAKTVAYATQLNLGDRYRKLIGTSATLNCCLNATALELFPNAEGNRIEKVSFRTPSGRGFEVHPRIVVLACGGIENARLLLASNSVHPSGIGNLHDAVGRFHMEHPIRSVGILPVASRSRDVLPFTNPRPVKGCVLQGTFGLSAETRGREHLLDLHVRAYRYNDLEGTEPVIRGKRAMAKLLGGAGSWKDLLLDAAAAARPRSLRYLAWHVRNKLWAGAGFDHIRLTAFVEQEPDPENRITLSRDRDPNGQPLPHLTYRMSETTEASIRRTMEVMAEALRESGFDGLRYGKDVAHLAHYQKYGLHQMGSTRMSQSPRQGVVDRDCRVHGFANLFIAGSSVFPTGGAANPTWTIAALASRLADCLKNRIRDI